MSHTGASTSSARSLALVGTVHFDRQSYHALKQALHALGSSVIATEMSEWGIAFRRGHGRKLRGKLLRYVRRNRIPRHEAGELSAFLSLLSFPHEYLAARSVARQTKAHLVHLGRNRDSKAWLGRLLNEPWDDHKLCELSASAAQFNARLSFERGRAFHGDTVGIKAGLRDRLLSAKLRELIVGGTTVAAVLGWEHVSETVPGNVAALLRTMNPAGFLVVDGETVRLY